MSSLLVVDVGTTGLRAAIVDADATIDHLEYRPFPPTSPFPGLVEFDALALADEVRSAAATVLAEAGSVAAVGITNQRASTIVWDRASGAPIGPALGWQDLRTVTECITASAEHGLRLAPNQSATKIAWLLDNVDGARDRASELCFGTVDTRLTWVLSGGASHVTDPTNASVTGLLRGDGSGWDERACDALRIPLSMLPEIVDTTGSTVATAQALDGAPPITALAGDQQASLVGQGCVEVGAAKITFGTGGMLDVCSGTEVPARAERGAAGTFPIVAWSRDGVRTWAREAIMLSAGANVDWMCDGLGLIATSAESADLAAGCATADGAMYVPALLGLGTPYWDYGARGTLLGLTRGTTAAHVARAVLEGVAHRGVDLIEAAESDLGVEIPELRIDGGMSRNPVFVQALADLSGRPVAVSPVVEATTLGAGYLAGIAVGTWSGMDDVAASWAPAEVVEPAADDRDAARGRWADAVARAAEWIPELSNLDF